MTGRQLQGFEDIQCNPHWTYRRRAREKIYCRENFLKSSSRESWIEPLDRQKESEVPASSGPLAFLLRSFANASALLDGKFVHDHCIKSGLERDAYLEGLLVDLYSKCGALNDARALLATIYPRTILSWNTLIRAYAQQGQGREAFRLFEQLQRQGVTPDKVTLVMILSACASHVNLAEGKRIHALIEEKGFESDIVVGTALINMYGKCDSPGDAQKMFLKMPERDGITWNAMISVYVLHEQGNDALSLFDRMQCEGEIPNTVTFVETLSACACGDVTSAVGAQIHSRIMGNGHKSEIILGNALISMYGKRGSLENARHVFDAMHERSVVSWNALVSAYALHDHGREALLIFDQMKRERITPNKVTLLSCLSACASLRAITEGAIIHQQILVGGLEVELAIGNSLVNFYGKCSRWMDAQRVFRNMSGRNLFTWTVMIAAYGQNGQGKKAFQLFEQMQEEGELADKVLFISILDACASQAEGERIHGRIVGSGCHSDTVVGTALVNMYGKCGNVKSAKRVFDNLRKRNVVSWSAMITVYAQNGQGKEALVLYNLMQHEGLLPDSFTLGSILDACTSQMALSEGMLVHASIIGRNYESNVIVGTAMVNMYGKCGSMICAQSCFDRLLERDVISWNAIIATYAQHGRAKEVLQKFVQMQLEGIAPNKVTFISLLSACSHVGLVNEGCQCFSLMHQYHGIRPTADHYSCMIDLLGRAGRLDDAEEMIKSMPFPPTVMSLMSLLSACRYQVDIERGKRIAKRLYDEDPENVVPYLMLSNIYFAMVGEMMQQSC